jgi:hypothetical protein
VSLFGLPIEAAIQVASPDPVATVTRDGVFGLLRVQAGQHRLVVNGPGYAPVAEGYTRDGGLVKAGAGGDLTVVAREDAATVRGDGRGANGVRQVRVIEDYAGTIYDGQPVEADRFVVPVHRDGTYTVEVVDSDGQRGAYRVTPADFGEDDDTLRETVETGKATLARSLGAFLTDLQSEATRLAEADGASGQVVELVGTAQRAAEDTARSAEDGLASEANERLGAAVEDLQFARELLQGAEQDGYTDSSVAALDPQLERAVSDAEVANETPLA